MHGLAPLCETNVGNRVLKQFGYIAATSRGRSATNVSTASLSALKTIKARKYNGFQTLNLSNGRWGDQCLSVAYEI